MRTGSLLGVGSLLLLATARCSTPVAHDDAANDSAADAPPVDAIEDTTPPPPPEVTLAEGTLRGGRGPGYLEFFGIPYAAPPVGPLRWTPPRAPAPWASTRDATIHPAHCPQSLLGSVSGDEDCLYLNVHTPDPMPQNAPVMVWIHGGGFVLGEGIQTDGGTRGDLLAAQHGVIVVSMNYRLGALGFAAHAGLSSEGGGHSGNYGLLDQQFAMQWVRDHIAAFGGDPHNVTLFGESAGGMSVAAHMAAPTSNGLFARAIVESGPFALPMKTLAEAEMQGTRLATALGCTGSDALACMRAAPANRLVDAIPSPPAFVSTDPMYADWSPVIDGGFFPSEPMARIRAGMVAQVPLILGWNHDEGTLFVQLGMQTMLTAAQYPDALTAIVGSDTTRRDQVIAHYPLSAYSAPWQALAAVITDVAMVCPSRHTLRAMAPHLPHAWNYVFTYPNAAFQLPAEVALGAFHSAEVQYVFGHPARIGRVRFSGDDLTLQQTMMGYWTRFATGGDPNGGAATMWPAYDATAEANIELDVMPRTAAHASADACAFWESLGIYP